MDRRAGEVHCSSSFKELVYNEQVATLIDMETFGQQADQGAKIQLYMLL
jgi:hypothetical protein